MTASARRPSRPGSRRPEAAPWMAPWRSVWRGLDNGGSVGRCGFGYPSLRPGGGSSLGLRRVLIRLKRCASGSTFPMTARTFAGGPGSRINGPCREPSRARFLACSGEIPGWSSRAERMPGCTRAARLLTWISTTARPRGSHPRVGAGRMREEERRKRAEAGLEERAAPKGPRVHCVNTPCF